MVGEDHPGGEGRAISRDRLVMLVEIVVVLLTIAAGLITFWTIQDSASEDRLLTPAIAALLLLANLVPMLLLTMLVGRRLAMRRAKRYSSGRERGRLQARLVAIFSIVASVPIVLTVIAASVIFQSGVEFWLSDRARNAFGTSMNMVREAQEQIILKWANEGRAMAKDLSTKAHGIPVDSDQFHDYLLGQTYYRNFEQVILFRRTENEKVQVLDYFDPPSPENFQKRVDANILNIVKGGKKPYVDLGKDTVWLVTDVPETKHLFLYVGTSVNAEFLNKQQIGAQKLLSEYATLQDRARSLQLKFNGALYGIAIILLGISTAVAFAVADRLLRPINELVGAARSVTGGDLTARVPLPRSNDEIGTLARAFNRMTERLQEQTSALVAANDQIESRHALVQAVMAGVSAGVISIAADGTIRLINSSAADLLHIGEEQAVGSQLADVSPELATALAGEGSETIIQLTAGGEARTLAVKVTADENNRILTFDDITQQLLDQRRAAWSDVARRIAHEIKNPLTPIQLAAERLQRRYGRNVDAEDTTFARLTDTIIRQVGDLRRMVDEFSSFARMPKPVFRDESLVDIVRQTVFLHEVAHSGVDFVVEHDDPGPHLVCDRRQLGQALTNIVKNAVEAVQAREDCDEGEVRIAITQAETGATTITVADTGIGLPVERDRIVEPYMTTRDRGTGLGLAIVKKIVEEHFGTITFSDRPGGGTLVRIDFDAALLAGLEEAGPQAAGEGETPRPALTRNKGA
ncbi:sensor histidine kinase NtrY-like [Stakelama saccharophila]|uniref:histidine kinase n=1 Tax=Stakelama saccharophila TaxID=3075605 RepID=A0ABZ0B6M6_9SPHN|nr:ATP-binding protein [Stakelama sp. W311]WNO52538.1 ATP-binding protein [Stakelama sp. W311]